MYKIDEEMYRIAMDVLAHGPVRFMNGQNDYGFVPPSVLIHLIHDGKAEEFRGEHGWSYVRLKEETTK